MKQTKKIIVLFLMLLICIGQKAWSQTVVASGTLEGGISPITWTLTETQAPSLLHLSFEGTGAAIPDFESVNATPWARVRYQGGKARIGSVSFSEGITRIGSYALAQTYITSVSIPAKCKKIDAKAFYKNLYLKEIYIPSSVTSIASDAFQLCSNVNFVHYDGTCTSSIAVNFSDLAATGKLVDNGLGSITVPSGWEKFHHGDRCKGGAWVASNTNLTKLLFYAPESGATVNYASSGSVLGSNRDNPDYHPWRVNCYKCTSLEINENISAIDAAEFSGYSNSDVNKMGYTNMQTITVDSENESFVVGENGALYDKDMTTVYLYPAKNTATDIEIPATVTKIGASAFYGAKNLQSITFLGTINTIGEYSFAQANSLSYFKFNTSTAPASYPQFQAFYSTAFVGLPEQGMVVAEEVTEDFRTFTNTIGTDWVLSNSNSSVQAYISNGTLYVVGEGEYNVESSKASWYSDRFSINKIVVKEGITNIGRRAFANCTKVTEVALDNRGTIGYKAFDGCTALTRVNIGTGLEDFKYEVPFSGCSNLSVVNVADLAFFFGKVNLDLLTSSSYGTAKEKTLMVNGVTHDSSSELVIPEGVTSIPNDAFRYFKNVTKIKLPSTMSEIWNNSFKNYTYLTQVTLPSSVTSVGENAFEGCTALKTVTLPSSVTSVGSYAFSGCTALTTVTLNNSGTIGYKSFNGCTALTRVNIGTGLTGFKKYDPFSGCSNLSVVNVADLASFRGLDYLDALTDSYYGTAKEKILMVNGITHNSSDDLVIPEGVTYIPNDAFRYFKNVTKIKLPSTMTRIADDNFKNHTYLTQIVLPSTTTYVGSGAFWGCTNLKRIVCLAETPPEKGSNLIEKPDTIILKTVNPSAYSSMLCPWWEFNVTGLIHYVNYMDLSDYSSLTSNGYLIANLNSSHKVMSWSSTNTDIAYLGKTTDSTAKVFSNDFVYDGTTELPYKEFAIKADLGDYDSIIWNMRLYPREVVLTDGSVYKNSVTERLPNGNIKYTRTYAEKYANHLQCFYVPFDVEVTDELLEGFTFYELYMVSQEDQNGNGEIEEDEPLVMLLTKLPAGHILHANMPYYIRPKAASTLTVTAKNAKLYAATNGSVSCSTTKNEYTLTGIYSPTNIKGYYTMSAKGNFSYYTKDTNLGSYRWYMSVRNRRGSGEELENYARPIQIVIDGEEETTGISVLDDKASAPQNGKIYTLDGRQVTDFETLPSGIYIINGKKVFKK